MTRIAALYYGRVKNSPIHSYIAAATLKNSDHLACKAPLYLGFY
jgi:hypothetical protein